MIVFYVYTIYDFESVLTDAEHGWLRSSENLRIALVAIICYFVILKLVEFIKLQGRILKISYWSYLDYVTITCIIVGESLLYSSRTVKGQAGIDLKFVNEFDNRDKTVRSIYSFCSFIFCST